jgi:hypothetical protein
VFRLIAAWILRLLAPLGTGSWSHPTHHVITHLDRAHSQCRCRVAPALISRATITRALLGPHTADDAAGRRANSAYPVPPGWVANDQHVLRVLLLRRLGEIKPLVMTISPLIIMTL